MDENFLPKMLWTNFFWIYIFLVDLKIPNTKPITKEPRLVIIIPTVSSGYLDSKDKEGEMRLFRRLFDNHKVGTVALL